MRSGFPRPTRRSGLGLGAGGAAALALPFISRAQAKPGPDTVNLQLAWIPNSNQLGDIVAKQLGYFEDEGLDFHLQPGGPNNNGIPIVASGQYEVGDIAGSTNLMLAAAQGLPVRGFAAGLQKHPFAFLSKSEKPVKKAADFPGEARVTLIGLPNKAEAEAKTITKDTTELVLHIKTAPDTPTGNNANLFCQVVVTIDGEPIVHNLGTAALRVDVPIPPKADAPMPMPVAAAPMPKPAEAPPKPLSRLEKLRLEAAERAKAAAEGDKSAGGQE